MLMELCNMCLNEGTKSESNRYGGGSTTRYFI